MNPRWPLRGRALAITVALAACGLLMWALLGQAGLRTFGGMLLVLVCFAPTLISIARGSRR